MAENWQPIRLSAKVFGHLSQGLYRTPAGAIKELISNSFDADAQLVRIHTGFPRFETFSCEDDGSGMSLAEFERLMNRGIGTSFKRADARTKSDVFDRPLVGRLGLGILALAQICTQFEIVSHHGKSKSAFSATIKFPPYTRAEMDKIGRDQDAEIRGGTYLFKALDFDASKKGVRVFSRHLREPFRKRMRTLTQFANKKAFGKTSPYRTFDGYLDAIYSGKSGKTQSLNLLSDYDQLLFGLALSPPLPSVAERNAAAKLPHARTRQSRLESFKFEVTVDNITLANPVCLPSGREGATADQCKLGPRKNVEFPLTDGPVSESCVVGQHTIEVDGRDEKFAAYEFRYSNDDVAGSRLSFGGYLFQQTGRLYPRDIQGVLIRLNNVAIGKYDNSMLTYPYAEGPRYSMVSGEVFIEAGFDDALNIDRDSFNELHPHYMRVQAYVHALLHGLIFPQTWSEEKVRNKARRTQDETTRQERFVESYRKTTGDKVREIRQVSKPNIAPLSSAEKTSPIDFERSNKIDIDTTHPLLKPLLRRKKHASLVQKLAVAFERANREANPAQRRKLFYTLLADIFTDS